MFPWPFNVYGRSDEEGEGGDGVERSEIPGEWERGDYLVSCIQMTWFCVMSWRKT